MSMENKNSILYIIAGANGSGKSTLAEELLKAKQLEFLNADEIAKEISPDSINSVPISAGKLYFKRLNNLRKRWFKMTDRDTLELLNMFTTAAQIAKAKNKHEVHLKFTETAMIELLKKAFPTMKDNINLANIAKNIINGLC